MRRFVIPCLLVCVGCVGAATALSANDLELASVLRRFDEVQENIRTLRADFTETTESALLTKAIVAQGRVYLTKPDSVRWEYSQPEEMRFVISEDQYVGYFPVRKQAERRNIQRWREQLFRFLGLGQASAELSKFYDIRLGDTDAERPGTLLLVMDPKKKRVRKKMDAVRFWISESTLLPERVEYRSKNGNRRVIEFDDIAVNPELAASLYRMDLPADVVMQKGFSALSGFSSSN